MPRQGLENPDGRSGETKARTLFLENIFFSAVTASEGTTCLSLLQRETQEVLQMHMHTHTVITIP